MEKEQLRKASDESIEITREVLKTSLASIEKLTQINLDASKKFLQETTNALKEISEIKNPKNLFEKVSQLATNTAQNNISNYRNIYDVMTEMQKEIQKMLESQIQIAQKNMATAAEDFSKFNPGIKSAFSADVIKKWADSANETIAVLNNITTKKSDSKNNSKTSPAGSTTKTPKSGTAAKVKK